VIAHSFSTEMGCTPSQVALAYLQTQDFPVFPIIGTMNGEHRQDALAADDLLLTAEQGDWLFQG
jgi:aryl-alcohol dehydrogenase-like predicted oxidoreductase